MQTKIKELEPPDSLHLRAAEGWLELGNYTEANEELEQITPLMRAHPHVLAMRYEIYSQAKRWDYAVEIASTLVQQLPDNALHWINRSFALHELKRTREARDLLLPAAAKFPDGDAIRYNLACYECQLGNLPDLTLPSSVPDDHWLPSRRPRRRFPWNTLGTHNTMRHALQPL